MDRNYKKITYYIWVAIILLTSCSIKTNNISIDRDIFYDPYARNVKTHSLEGETYMVVTSNYLASEAGNKILEKGGNAIDATIAVQMVLNLVEPQSSGIGGGAFLLYYDAEKNKTIFFNGRETAPLKSHENIFLDEKNNPRKFSDVVRGGLSVGTPGLLKMLKLVHDKYGKLPWGDLFISAIKLSEDGFIPSKRIIDTANKLSYKKESKSLNSIYLEKEFVKNYELSQTFKLIAKDGIDVFYNGIIGQNIVNSVKNSKINPGLLSLEDLRTYKVKIDTLLCKKYRNKYKICSVNLPSSGGITLLQILGILENFDLPSYNNFSSEVIHLILEATKLAYKDRNQYIADIEFVPINQMLNKDYLKERSKLIKKDKVNYKINSGKFNLDQEYVINNKIHEAPSTTHISIIDKEGNAIAMTSSIEYLFGSYIMTNGFLLNNQLTDFSFIPKIGNELVANRVQPGKHPRSSMTPTFIFNENEELIGIIGSPGGSKIIQYVLKVIIAYLDFGMNIKEAIDFSNFVSINNKIILEKDKESDLLKKLLLKKGHKKIEIRNLSSGINAIIKTKDKIIGAADGRREGFVSGK